MSRLDNLDRAKTWLDTFRPLPDDVLTELRQRFEVRLTHHSTAIEGNTLTQSETQIVLEKGVTVGGKSLQEHLEVIGHRDALNYVIELASHNEPLTERTIRELHSLVMKGQEGGTIGAYRGLDVMAAGTEFRYPNHLRLPELMEGFITFWKTEPDLHPVLFASEAHLRFVTIHPFQDGNGRVGRLLLNLALLQRGYTIAVIPVERRTEYISALEAAQASGDRQPLDTLVVDAVEASLRESLQVCSSVAGATVPPGLAEWLA